MELFFPILRSCSLFDGIQQADMGSMLACLGAQVMAVKKNKTIWEEGDPADRVGIVLSGRAQVIKEDYYGNRSIVSIAEPGELIGESFSYSGAKTLPVSIIAAEDSKILHMDSRRITTSCCNACTFHGQLIQNMLRIVASKNLLFHQKLDIVAKRTTREKLLAYLTAQAKLQGSNSFTIPFDRQGLADYLGVERSAMSAEISKLRADGVLQSHKNHFTLLQSQKT